MRKAWQKATVAGALVTMALLTAIIASNGESTAQTPTVVGVDADPTGNTATSLGPIESCVSVATGDTFEVDVFVMDVVDLLAWETTFVYDDAIISIVDHDLQMFQAANAGSSILDISENLPDTDSQYRLSGADIGEPPSPDSGSGVLASLTLKAVGPGVSPARLAPIDVDGDGTADLATFLRDVRNDPISDSDDDGVFDGPLFDAEIAVDTACPPDTVVITPRPGSVSPSPSPSVSPTVTAEPTSVVRPTPAATPPNENEEGSTWTSGPWIVAYVVGGIAVLLAGAALFAVARRRTR